MPDIKWIKINTGIFDDEKIKLIERLPEGDTILIIWIKLLVLAGRCNSCGMIYIARDLPYTEDTLTMVLGRPAPIVKLALDTFSKFKMIEIINDHLTINNWEKHQNIDGMERVKQQTRLRVQRHRATKQIECNVTERYSNVTVTQQKENKNKNKKEKEKREKKPRPATLQECIEYQKAKGLNVDPEHFFNYFEASGWYDSKGEPVLNFKQKMITWHNHQRNPESKSTSYEDDKRKHYGNSHLL
jgi:predicted phage replisome organizer